MIWVWPEDKFFDDRGMVRGYVFMIGVWSENMCCYDRGRERG